MKSRRFLLSLSVGVGVEVVEVEVATLGCIFMHFSVLTFQFAVLCFLFFSFQLEAAANTTNNHNNKMPSFTFCSLRQRLLLYL